MVITSFFALLALLVLLGLIIGVARASLRARPVRPDHHHWVVRVLGAALFLAAVTAVGIGTWRGTAVDLAGPPLCVKVPTRTTGPIKSTADRQHIDLGPCKLIGTVLLASKEQDRFLPLCGESLALEWPSAANGILVFKGQYGGFNYWVTLDAREFVSWSKPGEIQTRNGISVITNGPGFSGSSSGATLKLDTLEIMPFGYARNSFDHTPLSIMPTCDGQDFRLLIHLTRADRDDPLAEMPVAGWLVDHAGKPRQDEPIMHNSYAGVRFDPNMPPGIRMLAFLGPSAFLLGLAAIAGSVVFRRGWRVPAFAGLLALMVLFAGWLDAMVLHRRADLTTDSEQAESVRCHALSGMVRGTFFHRGTAVARVRALATDRSVPGPLREFAGKVFRSDRSDKSDKSDRSD